MRFIRTLGLIALLLTPATSLAQRLPACAPPSLGTKAALVAALDSLQSVRGGAELAAAAIASLGQPVVGWALEVAADSSPSNPPARRAAALRVLRFARWKPAIPVLVRLAEPLKGDWVVWSGAINALTWYPYPELEPFWIELITFPRRVVREQALRGLGLVGTPQVIAGVRNATHKDTDEPMRALVADVEAKLRLPMAERVRQLDSAAAICSRAR